MGIKDDDRYPILTALIEKVKGLLAGAPTNEEERIANEEIRKSNELQRIAKMKEFENIDATQFAAQLNDKASVESVNLKADKTYVDTNIATLNNKINAAPKNTFATLQALQADTTANTTDGKKGLYVVSADGCWYFWNGTAWEAVQANLSKVDTFSADIDTAKKNVKLNAVKEGDINLFNSDTNFMPVPGMLLGDSFTFAIGSATSKVTAADNFIFYKKSVADSNISVVLESPATTQVWSGLFISSLDMKNRLTALIFPSTNTLEVWKMDFGSDLVNSPVSSRVAQVTLTADSVKVFSGVPIALSVDFIGDKLKISVNNELAYTYDIPSNVYTNGFVGIVADKSKAYTFSNFFVSPIKFSNTIVPSTMTKVLCIGTSITYGIGTTKSYVQRLQEKLVASYNKDAVCTNGGVSGNTSTDMLGRIDSLLTASPHIVIVESSINDVKKGVTIDPMVSKSNLSRIIKKCKIANAIPILTTCTPVDTSVSTTEWDIGCYQRIQKLNMIIRQLAVEERIRLVDNSKAFNNNFTYLADKIHPNDTGAEVMANEILNTIIKEV
jgi:lysophospholipase L1-like esterase